MPAVAPGSLLFLLCLLFTLLSRGSAERTVLNKIFTERSRHKHGDGSHSSEAGPAHKSAEGDDIANALSAGSGTLGTTPDALSNPPGTRDSGLGVETITDASTVKSELAEAKKEVSTITASKRQSLPLFLLTASRIAVAGLGNITFALHGACTERLAAGQQLLRLVSDVTAITSNYMPKRQGPVPAALC